MSALHDAARLVVAAWSSTRRTWVEECNAAVMALDAALKAQPEPAQEPVAWMVYTEDGKSVCVTDNPADFADEHRALPLYTEPPQRPPLTDEEIEDIYLAWDVTPGRRIVDLVRAVERKVRGEKE